MKYAIIAAGEGSRLANEGITAPKPLVKVGGECLIDRLIRIFLQNEASEIIVVCNEQASQVNRHLEEIERDGLNGTMVPLRHVVKTTPSSMHSFFELSTYLGNEPFILTTVDTIFKDEEFADYVDRFKHHIAQGTADGLMGVTDYIDDEKPLYVKTDESLSIEAFLDADKDVECRYISGGIYGLSPSSLLTLARCMQEGKSRMRNFQRGLIEDSQRLLAYPFSKVLDIDHAIDIAKAEQFLAGKKVAGVFRARRFSPNSVENDRKILELSLQKLSVRGVDVLSLNEEDVLETGELPEADIYLSMARTDEVLAMLVGKKSVNDASGVMLCNDRKSLCCLMRENGIPIPQENGTDGVWLKRGEGTAEITEDVVFCSNEEEVDAALRSFNSRGISKIVRQAHVVGDLVKFYGVAGTPFFYFFYPTDSGRSKFGSELHNGKAQHYAFDASRLKDTVDAVADITGVRVYGGDAVVKSDSDFVIIDFNDWPTFSPCREEAAEMIAILTQRYV